MMKLALVGIVGLAIGWYVMDSNAAMDKCMEKYSYSTCVYTLR